MNAVKYTMACTVVLFGAYFSSNSSTLPVAEATGNMTLRPDSIVHEIMYDPDSGKATGVKVIDRVTRETYEFTAKVIGFFTANYRACIGACVAGQGDVKAVGRHKTGRQQAELVSPAAHTAAQDAHHRDEQQGGQGRGDTGDGFVQPAVQIP